MRARAWCIVLAAGMVGTSCLRTVQVSTVDVTPSSSTQDAVLRNATNLPQYFTVVRAGVTAVDCPSILSDPALGTTLNLQRSVIVPVQDSTGVHHRAIGDYALTPQNRYGAQPGDGLRVDCTRLRAIGLVSL